MRYKFLCFLLFLTACSAKQEDNKVPIPPDEIPVVEHGYAVIPGPNGLKYHTGLRKVPEELRNMGESHVRLSDCENLPKEFDLRTMGLVSDIRDQGQCGSCWTFSMLGSLESALRGSGIILDLAEQELVSCDKGNYGCDGGNLNGFKYLINHGISLEKDYPYTSGDTGRNGSCKNASVAAKGVSFQYIGTVDRGPTEKELKCALVKYKTVPWITVGATNAWGSPPKNEKTPYNHCGKSQTNHAVGVVGYWEDSKGNTEWIMKNSWGENWGAKGYMSMPLGCNNFGEEVAFIEVEKKPDPSPGPTPTPSPCLNPPRIKLPAEVQFFAGSEVMLGVKAEANVAYSWTLEGKEIGKEAMIYVTPEKDSVYKLSAKNACGIAESQVRVRTVLTK